MKLVKAKVINPQSIWDGQSNIDGVGKEFVAAIDYGMEGQACLIYEGGQTIWNYFLNTSDIEILEDYSFPTNTSKEPSVIGLRQLLGQDIKRIEF